MKPEEANKLIRERRSFFQGDYTGERVDDSIIDQMLENANWAPTHKLTEPWRFIVFTGEGLRKLAEAQAEYYKKYTNNDNSFKEERYSNLLKKPMLSSHIIVVGMKRDEKKSVPEIEEMGAVFCAVQNIYLTATAYGVGCYLSTGGITYFEGAQEILGFDRDDKLVGFMHVGIRKPGTPTGKRKSIEEKVAWVRE
jgi:nitroreductase